MSEIPCTVLLYEEPGCRCSACVRIYKRYSGGRGCEYVLCVRVRVRTRVRTYVSKSMIIGIIHVGEDVSMCCVCAYMCVCECESVCMCE